MRLEGTERWRRPVRAVIYYICVTKSLQLERSQILIAVRGVHTKDVLKLWTLLYIPVRSYCLFVSNSYSELVVRPLMLLCVRGLGSGGSGRPFAWRCMLCYMAWLDGTASYSLSAFLEPKHHKLRF